MCWICQDTCYRLFPDFSEEVRQYILWEKTGFPFVPVNVVCSQLKEAKQELVDSAFQDVDNT